MIIHCKYDELVPVDSLRPYEKNRNVHTPEQIERLAKLLEYQGVRAPIVVVKTDDGNPYYRTIAKGHGTLDAIKLNGWKEAPVVFQEFDSEEQLYAYVQSDNAIAAWAELDLAGINVDLPELGPDFDIDLLGIKDFVLEPADKHGEGDADEVPATPKVAKSKRGELWLLGNHRVLCGDATSREDVERLMAGEKADMVFTDPPYGINLETDYVKRYGNEKSSRESAVYGDDNGIDLRKILEFSRDTKEVFIWGADNYPDCLPRGGSWVVWDKSVPAVDGIASDFELCWSRERHHYSMVRKLWKGAKAREETGQEGSHKTRWGHPTQKPIELGLYFFENWGKKAKTIVDFFGGSGTTLIACEKTGRRCFGMEIEPIYIDVILQRWSEFTGEDPVREDGVKWSALEVSNA